VLTWNDMEISKMIKEMVCAISKENVHLNNNLQHDILNSNNTY